MCALPNKLWEPTRGLGPLDGEIRAARLGPLNQMKLGRLVETVKLTIVIPALNEQDAIGSTIEQTLAARRSIVERGAVDEVEVIVVSDGSTDRTAEIAAGYDDVKLVVFEQNRGYGAAIKKGFETGTGELVGFLDADGTCDPKFFADLTRAIVDEKASVALGSRLGPTSRMPRVRRLGNRIYALILSVLSNRVVTDTASGMRIIRRDVLERLYPLPDGLHFTPAMSARVLMDDELTVVERPMHYEERIGESKLHVVRDGVRFLRTIMAMTLMWRPARLFLAGGIGCLALMTMLGVYPIEHWLRMGALREDMIYRLLSCSLLGTLAVTLLAFGVLCDNLQRLWNPSRSPVTFFGSLLDRVFTGRGLAIALAPALPLLFWLVGPGVWSRITSGYVVLHWSRILLAGLIVVVVGQVFLTTLVANLIRFHVGRRTLVESATGSGRAPAISRERAASALAIKPVSDARTPKVETLVH